MAAGMLPSVSTSLCTNSSGSREAVERHWITGLRLLYDLLLACCKLGDTFSRNVVAGCCAVLLLLLHMHATLREAPYFGREVGALGRVRWRYGRRHGGPPGVAAGRGNPNPSPGGYVANCNLVSDKLRD
jgi:hypothetical protein